MSVQRKNFRVFILYPETPTEILLNAEERVVDEEYVERCSNAGLGSVQIYTDDDGLEVRKYGRLVFKECSKSLWSN